MRPTLRISLASLVLLLPLAAGSASAQNARADNIRLMCLDRAATWKDFNREYPHAQNRVNLYSSCMLDYGLLP